MSTIQAKCPMCSSRVQLLPSALTITVAPRAGAPGRCEFTCPNCAAALRVPLEPDLAALLVGQGARMSPEADARARHPAGRGRVRPVHPDGPRLTYDDLLDFHLLLERDDWFDRLLELARR